MNFRQLLLACGIPLASLSVGAQMPAPVLSDSAVVQAEAGKQLETLLLCKPGTNLLVFSAGTLDIQDGKEWKGLEFRSAIACQVMR